MKEVIRIIADCAILAVMFALAALSALVSKWFLIPTALCIVCVAYIFEKHTP